MNVKKKSAFLLKHKYIILILSLKAEVEILTQKIKLTIQRKAILDVVQQSDDHPSAADIIERLRIKGFNFAYGTVYNSLRYLTEQQLIRELKLNESVSRYDARIEDHQHIVCTVCGKVEEIMLELPHEWLKDVTKQTRYQINNPHIVMEGTCEACSSRT